jgi:hypothetical protein
MEDHDEGSGTNSQPIYHYDTPARLGYRTFEKFFHAAVDYCEYLPL